MARLVTSLTKKEVFNLYIGSYVVHKEEVYKLTGTLHQVAFVETLGGLKRKVPLKDSVLILKPLTRVGRELLIKIARNKFPLIENEDQLMQIGRELVTKHSTTLGYKAVDILRKNHFCVGIPREYYITKTD